MALWDKISGRGQVEDRRGSRGPLAIGGGLGIGGIAILMAISYLSGGNPLDILTQVDPSQLTTQTENSSSFEGADDYEVFASTVLGSTNEYWKNQLATQNINYTPPTLVLFRSATQGGCGISNSAVGPHYCPLDSTICLDETFFDELQNRFKAQGGDVAEAYVIAHEVGHHVQNQLGIMEQVNIQSEQNPSRTSELSVKQELQADCFAGLWAHSIRDLGVFEPGEINEALNAAAAIGDDKIQSITEGRVTPENWTHGSSDQRVQWFNTGFNEGSFNACNTF